MYVCKSYLLNITCSTAVLKLKSGTMSSFCLVIKKKIKDTILILLSKHQELFDSVGCILNCNRKSYELPKEQGGPIYLGEVILYFQTP